MWKRKKNKTTNRNVFADSRITSLMYSSNLKMKHKSQELHGARSFLLCKTIRFPLPKVLILKWVHMYVPDSFWLMFIIRRNVCGVVFFCVQIEITTHLHISQSLVQQLSKVCKVEGFLYRIGKSIFVTSSLGCRVRRGFIVRWNSSLQSAFG